MLLSPVEHQILLNSSEKKSCGNKYSHYAVLDLFRLKVKNSFNKSAHKS